MQKQHTNQLLLGLIDRMFSCINMTYLGRDRRELTALRRERDVAQTMINQLRASRDSPNIFLGNQSAIVNKCKSDQVKIYCLQRTMR